MKVSWFGRLVPMFLWIKLDLVFLKGYVMPSIVFCVVFGIDMTLGSLSSNGLFCFPTLLKFWCEASGTETCWPFVGACS